jgi:homoserine O-acetyltransferase
MKLLIAAFIALFPLLSAAQSPSTDAGPIEHSFVLHNFQTESGVVLPEAKIVYGTYGHLNAAKDNAILLPSHYMADMHSA